jgi:ribosome-associated protein
MTTETIAKKDTQKLQRAIVDGLEDVKAQDIQVFDTEHLSPLFERVIVASGTSNRQTKALAASVRDAVREAGFPKPRIEGEANGEWIIVDCAQVVVHIMQPNFRAYYHLEELWGEKPVRMKFGATKPLVKATPDSAAKPPAKKAATAGKKPAARKAAPRPMMPELAPEDMPKTPVVRAASRAGAKAAPKPDAKAPAKAAAARTSPKAAAPARAAKPAPAASPAAKRARAPAAGAKAPARKPRSP